MKRADFQAALRAIRVFNTYDLLTRFADEKDDIAVGYTTGGGGLAGIGDPRRSYVWAARRHIGAEVRRGQYSQQWFLGRREASFRLAVEYAVERSGIAAADWVACPLIKATIVPASVVARARAAINWQEEVDDG